MRDEKRMIRRFVMDIIAVITAFVAGVIHIAKMLGMTVVAEGVEDIAQWDFLRDHNCDLIQGFCAGQPLTEDDFIDFYRGNGDLKK